MTYRATSTVQITAQGEPTSSLRVHEADSSGEPRCGQVVRPWRGKTMVLTPQGPGIVTCRRCLNLAQP
jgi:hypothetical protein